MGIKLNSSSGGSVEINPPATASTFTLTAPAVNDTIVTRTSTDTLTNKTLTSPVITGASMSSMSSSVLTAMTPVTPSGTSVDFTGIPSWARRVTVLLSAVSTSGTSLLQIRLGTSGGVESTGYLGETRYGSSATASTASTAITPWPAIGSASSTLFAMIPICLVSSSTNAWVTCGTSYDSGGQSYGFSYGKTLSGTLTQVRITTVNGTDTFDAGTVNVFYE